MFNSRITCLSLLTYGVSSIFAHSAIAQPSADVADTCARSTPDAAAADELFTVGADFYRRGTLDRAAEKFAESYCLWPSAKTLQVLAQCREKQSKFASAYSLYLKAAELARDTRRISLENDCKERAAKIAEFRSFLTIRVESAVPGLTIERNGTPVGAAQFGVRLPLDPGDYLITAQAAGFAPFEQRVSIGMRADDRAVSIPRLQPQSAPSRAGDVAPHVATAVPLLSLPKSSSVAQRMVSFSSTSRSNPWPWLLGGVGVGSLVVGGVSGALALHDKSTIDSACNNRSPCSDSHALSVQSRRDLEWTVARVTVPVGLLAIAGAATWLTLDSPKRERVTGDAAVSVIGTSVDERGGNVWVRGRF